MLTISNLSLKYDDNIIFDNADFEFKPGEVTVVTGQSGCGKSTLIKLIDGVIPHIVEVDYSGELVLDSFKSGEINLKERDITERSGFISTVFQNPKNQFYAINTLDEIAFALENRCVDREEIFEIIDEYTDLLDTRDLLNKDIFKLSGGQKQMVAITSVAVMNQEVYIFDEPSSSLDLESIARLKSAIETLKQLGKIIIIAEHRLYYLKDVMDRMYIIENKEGYRLDKDEITQENIEKHGLRALNEITKDDLKTSKYIVKRICEGRSGDESVGCESPLCCRDYKYSYGSSNVLDMDIDISDKITFIIGKNGIGKSTFLRCICGLNKKFKGKTYIGERPVKKAHNHISLVMQDVNYQLFTDSVWSEISIVSDDEEKKKRVLDELGLLERMESHPQSLSGGEKQRLSIALCKASDKELVIFDEPTSGLCRKNMMRIIRFIREMAEEGKRIIIVTHDYEFIRECGGTIIEFV